MVREGWLAFAIPVTAGNRVWYAGFTTTPWGIGSLGDTVYDTPGWNTHAAADFPRACVGAVRARVQGDCVSRPVALYPCCSARCHLLHLVREPQ